MTEGMASQYSPRGTSNGPGRVIGFEVPPHEPTDPGRNDLVPGVIERYEDIVKSANDRRLYRGLLLSNMMKVLLVSDPTTDLSAAALDVNVGHMSDPDELPGLAHFCEHMLFLGTKKYPAENEYFKFISEHGGYSNAYTGTDQTTYYFDIVPTHLNKALDVFAQFFISPLFTESATGRELSAVNSEYEMNLASDDWRLSQLRKNLCTPNHPFHNFDIGNKETLEAIPNKKNIDVRKELLKFHNEWYSSNIMTLVVLGKESLDELEDMVVPLFSSIEDRSVTAPSWPEHPYPPELCRQRVYCVPVKDTLSLYLAFPIPDTIKYYKSGPEHYLSCLLRHEGPGSLQSVFKKRGWCNREARGFGFFVINAELTEEGINQVDGIIKLVFQYIAMLKTQGPQFWIKEEQNVLNALSFRFQDTICPIWLVENNVHRLQEYPMEDVLTAYNLMPEWRPELIMELLSLLTPDQVLIQVVAKAFEDKCTMVEPWYGTKYLKEDIDEDILKEWNEVQLTPELHLPPPNEFIPSNLSLEEDKDPTSETVAPEIIKDTNLMRLWYKKDSEFLLPKAVINLNFNSPLVYVNPLSYNLLSMWVDMLVDSLEETSYAAGLAGLNWSIGPIEKYGLYVSIEGYDEKQHVLLDKIMDLMVSFTADPKRFYVIREKYIRELKNFETHQPFEHAIDQESNCLEDVVYTRSDLLNAVKDMTPELVTEFASKMIRNVHIEGLMYGNLSRERAAKMADSLEQKLPKDGIPVLPQQLLLCREVDLGQGSWYVREIQNSVHRTSCTSLYYACGQYELRPNVTLDLLSHIMSEPCFNILRTKEQLGYIVNNGTRQVNGVHGLRVTVQSVRHPSYLEQRIESFIQEFLEYLQNMSDDDFIKHKTSLATKVLEKPKQMSAASGRMWCEIIQQVYNFDRARVEVEQLNTITKEELIQFYMKYIGIDSPHRQKLSVYVVSTAEGGAGNENTMTDEKPDEKTQKIDKKAIPITDLVEFKSSRGLYPRCKPYIDIPLKGLRRY